MFLNSGPFALFKWEALFSDWHIFAAGFGYTLLISLCALILSLAIGVLVGIASTTQSRLLRAIARVYVEFFQNTPLLIQIFFLFNGLPFLGIVLNITTIGIIGVGMYHGAYIGEVVRSGIGSIAKGQLEAALSQGFSYWQSMRYIVIPQATRIILPPLTMQAVNLIKNTSVVAIISGADIMFTAKSWSSGNIYYGPAYVVAGLLYFILCFPLATLAKRMEDKTQGGPAEGNPNAVPEKA
ncbi:amino acid ABC transporter permease [Papillibacter cinnamivorans]|uniref:Putative glutamine transport system permease protein n=1 Tax=Papillibacter cinnamivorans DSM 12816 TaxID=1122930 RepID=A0A1W2CUX7_9FIRM|nr:amino acid ABC transporter permease [Papillibacter cinnamivorans]SMC89029.1 putative glutamine transport system permease protein [Papillibacter cinnamivorans DSM 12816]